MLASMLAGLMDPTEMLVSVLDRSDSFYRDMYAAREKYIDAPPKDQVRPKLIDLLRSMDPKVRENCLVVLDRNVLSTLQANDSPTLKLLYLARDLDVGWSQFRIMEDGENVEIITWDGAEYKPQSEIKEGVRRAMLQLHAEEGSNGEPPRMSARITWAALDRNPFLKATEVVEDAGKSSYSFPTFSFAEAIKLAEDFGFVRHEAKDESECWRSPERATTSDDICLIIKKAGGFLLVPSVKVRDIKDATNQETCQCRPCVERRADEAKDEAEAEKAANVSDN